MCSIMSKQKNISSNKKVSLNSFLRGAHRDIGYFVTGVLLIYALSGIFLTHKNLFPATKTVRGQLVLPVGAEGQVFEEIWDKYLADKKLIRCTDKGEQIDFYMESGKGFYLKKTGELRYEFYLQNKFILLLNQFHENQIKGWRTVADLFAGMLLFLAISGLFLARGKNGFRRRGIWLFFAGFVLILLFLLF